MSIRSAPDVVSDYTAAIIDNDVASIGSLRADGLVLDFVHYDARAAPPISEENTQTFWPAWFAAFPEYDYEVTRTIAAAEVVVTQWVFIGTHTESLGPPVFDEPVAPTGRTIRFRGVSV